MKTSLYSTSSWKRQGVALLGIAALLTLCGQSLVYAQLSASDIAAMKQEIAKQKYTFTVDENPATPQKYGIQGIPTVIFFKGGEVAKQLVGYQAQDKIQKAIDELFPK